MGGRGNNGGDAPGVTEVSHRISEHGTTGGDAAIVGALGVGVGAGEGAALAHSPVQKIDVRDPAADKAALAGARVASETHTRPVVTPGRDVGDAQGATADGATGAIDAARAAPLAEVAEGAYSRAPRAAAAPASPVARGVSLSQSLSQSGGVSGERDVDDAAPGCQSGMASSSTAAVAAVTAGAAAAAPGGGGAERGEAMVAAGGRTADGECEGGDGARGGAQGVAEKADRPLGGGDNEMESRSHVARGASDDEEEDENMPEIVVASPDDVSDEDE